MQGRCLSTLPVALAAEGPAGSAGGFERDVFTAGGKRLEITFLGHGTLMFDYDGTIVHLDPVPEQADYSQLPRADLVLVTHEHRDHLNPGLIEELLSDDGEVVANPASREQLSRGIGLANGESVTVKEIGITAIPAYNTTPERAHHHPKGRDNGYLLDFAGFSVYVAGDTEPIPEMSRLGRIDVAFLPVNYPFTMTVTQATEAARVVSPQVLYPYHYGETMVSELVKALEGEPSIEVRLRRLA